MLKDILKLKGTQKISKQKQAATNGGRNEINPHCCLQVADHYMEGIPNYSDPSNEMYLTYEQRHDLWTQAFDGCMGGQSAVCLPAL